MSVASVRYAILIFFYRTFAWNQIKWKPIPLQCYIELLYCWSSLIVCDFAFDFRYFVFFCTIFHVLTELIAELLNNFHIKIPVFILMMAKARENVNKKKTHNPFRLEH